MVAIILVLLLIAIFIVFFSSVGNGIKLAFKILPFVRNGSNRESKTTKEIDATFQV